MGNENFMRRYIIQCGPMGQKGFRIGHIQSASDDALHISFNVEKSAAETSNSGKVQIWNLSDTSLKVLDKKDCVVELRAGYGNNTSLIVVGSVTSVTTIMDNADRMTEIEVVDGRVALRDTYITLSYNGKVDCKALYQIVADEMGLPVLFGSNVKYKTMPNGFSFVGKAKNALQKIASYCGHSWTIQNQVLHVTNPGQPISSRGFLLNAETGLLSIPSRISFEYGDATVSGWEVQYLLNGAIGVNDVVKLESNIISGYFLVHKVTLDGDNVDGDWMCTAQLLEIET